MTTTTTLNMNAYVASEQPVLLTKTIASGADLVKGTILGRVTASGKLMAYDAGNDDGTQAPVAVLMEDAAAASADVEAVVGFSGIYVSASMTGLDAAAILALEPKAIYFV